MFDFKPTEDIISMSEFRNTLADCVARTAETHRPIILTQNGRATSVFLSAAQWEKITEKLYNAELYEDILVSEGESERGEVYTQDEVKRMLDNELKKIYEASRVFVLHSEEESQGIAFAEAMATGMPVVATKVGGVPFVVTDGATGLLSDYGDINAFAENIKRLLLDLQLWHDLSDASVMSSESYHWKGINDRIMALYGFEEMK